MENIRTILRDLPSSIDGFTIASNDGWYTIVLKTTGFSSRTCSYYS